MDFETFLKKYRKSNGEYLLPKTIEKMCYYVTKYLPEKNEDLGLFVDEINKIVAQKKSNVLRASFKLFLQYSGYEVEKDGQIVGTNYKLDKLKNKQISAFSSKRYMQSQILSEEEIKRLFESADLQMKTILCFMFDLGIRRDEVLSIKFKDITYVYPTDDDYQEKINAGIYATILIHGKGKKTRTGYLHKTAIEYLITLHPGENNPEDYVFRFKKPNGDLYVSQGQQLYYQFKKLGLKNLDKNIHPHMSRHTFAQNLSNGGFPATAIQNLLGHSNLATSSIYLENSNLVGKNAMLERGNDNMKNVDRN